MSGEPTLSRSRSQATLVSHASQSWEIRWRSAEGEKFSVLNRGVPLQVALNPHEPVEFFYRALGASGDWRSVQEKQAP